MTISATAFAPCRPASRLTKFLAASAYGSAAKRGATMTRRRLAPFLRLLALLVAGSASDPVDPKDQSLPLVYGHIDMPGAPSRLRLRNRHIYHSNNTSYLSAAPKAP